MFDCILLSLQEASWPSHSRRSDVISGTSPSSGYFNFGVQLSRRSCLTQVTRELPEMCRDLVFSAFFSPPNDGTPSVSHGTASAFYIPILRTCRALRTFRCRLAPSRAAASGLKTCTACTSVLQLLSLWGTLGSTVSPLILAAGLFVSMDASGI